MVIDNYVEISSTNVALISNQKKIDVKIFYKNNSGWIISTVGKRSEMTDCS